MQNVFFDRFYRYEDIEKFLFSAVSERKDVLRLESLHETKEGRKVYLAVITDFSTGEDREKSAYYIQANVHANEGAGTTAAIYFIHRLLNCPEYEQVLKDMVFYIVPRVNPDGAEYALSTHGPIRSRIFYNDRVNGLIPKDMNEDGYILNMRIEDPSGTYREDEEDRRIMVRRRPGDCGPFYKVYTEGYINEYDGREPVSGFLNTDFNRNYPSNWQDAENSGRYPFSEPEIRAVGDFLLNHNNVFAGIDFHCGTQAILRPSSLSDKDMNQKDFDLIYSIGKIAEKITGFSLMKTADYRKPWKPAMSTPGDSMEWAYFKLGISFYAIEVGWGFSSAGIYKDESFGADDETMEKQFMRKILKFHDEKSSVIFTPWKDFDHPQLGKVQIGGLMTGEARFMYPPDMISIAPKTSEFMLLHASYRPTLIFSGTNACLIENNVYRIRTKISNVGGFDLNIMQAGSSVIKKVLKVTLEDEDILNHIRVYEIADLAGGGGTFDLEWFIRTENEEAIITAYHPKTGYIKEAVRLKNEKA